VFFGYVLACHNGRGAQIIKGANGARAKNTRSTGMSTMGVRLFAPYI